MDIGAHWRTKGRKSVVLSEHVEKVQWNIFAADVITKRKELLLLLGSMFQLLPGVSKKTGGWWFNDVFSVFLSLANARLTIPDGHSSHETLSIHLVANEMKINGLSAAHTTLNFLIRLSFVFLSGAKIKPVQKCWKKTSWCAKRGEISSVCVPLWEYYLTDW